MTTPRLEVDLDKIEANTRHLVEQLDPRGIRVTGVTKAALGSPGVGAAMMRGGASGLADSRIENLARLAEGTPEAASRTLIRSPMLSQVERVVRSATTSLNTGLTVLDALDLAARNQRRTHHVILMVELGDLREGVSPAAVVELARETRGRRRLRLSGIGTNLACQSGVVPDDANMGELSRLVEKVESSTGQRLTVVSGGNSANLPWALSGSDPGRINDLRLGEAILLGTEPLERSVLPGLHADAFQLVAEVIEVGVKQAGPRGSLGQTAYGELVPIVGTASRRGTFRQVILALGRQDVLLDGLVAPAGMEILGMSSDHLVLDQGDHRLEPGDEVRFAVGYGGLVQAIASPFVTVEETRRETWSG
ncbi:alanine/ornithine racemase family PLP-dependent enzyme [Nocardioides cavernaquae]|uniref:Alanine/ornithine racemase family PLP-dependent enzyme n=1 Tax=Nocardioides cavernaquae TaxID=2321396 RepID=A0A3A5HD80_9ACTN|nr:alanine/ornithine racemase family PLP-dependent enzyme [Nocardioides cavernaquae]RJS45990.1 alanine/ornithine racemase family PLP-dependent enzyme [Nocardioides cavernaquae]